MGSPRRFTRLAAAAAVAALLLAVPIGTLAHEHLDQTDSHCRICKVSGAETAVFHAGPALPVPEGVPDLHPSGSGFVPDSTARTPGAPRAPPS